MFKKINLFLASFLFLSSTSCSQLNVSETNLNKLDSQKRADYLNQLRSDSATVIVNISNPNFKIKKIASDIKSFDIFLTTSQSEPRSNVIGSIISVNRANISNEIKFNDVPVGGPYFAAISAYDGLTDNTEKNNITFFNSEIIEDKKQISISSSSVTVSEDLTLSFSGTETEELTVDLKLISETF